MKLHSKNHRSIKKACNIPFIYKCIEFLARLIPWGRLNSWISWFFFDPSSPLEGLLCDCRAGITISDQKHRVIFQSLLLHTPHLLPSLMRHIRLPLWGFARRGISFITSSASLFPLLVFSARYRGGGNTGAESGKADAAGICLRLLTVGFCCSRGVVLVFMGVTCCTQA